MKNKQTIFIFLSMLIAGFLWFSQQSLDAQISPDGQPVISIVVTTGLHLRESPSLQSKIIADLPFGTRLPILGQTNYLKVSGMRGKWLNVSFLMQKGWVFKPDKHKYIQEVIVTQPEDLLVVREEGLDLRTAPSMEAFLITHLSLKTTVQRLTGPIFYNRQVWVYVSSQEHKGYVLYNGLATAIYSKEQLEKGPFVGMVLSNSLPDSYKIDSRSFTVSQMGEYEIKSISYMNTNYSVLVYRGEIVQIVFNFSIYKNPPNTTLYFGSGSGYGFFCTDALGNEFPIALIDSPLNHKNEIQGELQNTWSYKDSIHTVWVFDNNTKNLVEVDPPPGSMCHYYEHDG